MTSVPCVICNTYNMVPVGDFTSPCQRCVGISYSYKKLVERDVTPADIQKKKEEFVNRLHHIVERRQNLELTLPGRVLSTGEDQIAGMKLQEVILEENLKILDEMVAKIRNQTPEEENETKYEIQQLKMLVACEQLKKEALLEEKKKMKAKFTEDIRKRAQSDLEEALNIPEREIQQIAKIKDLEKRLSASESEKDKFSQQVRNLEAHLQKECRLFINVIEEKSVKEAELLERIADLEKELKIVDKCRENLFKGHEDEVTDPVDKIRHLDQLEAVKMERDLLLETVERLKSDYSRQLKEQIFKNQELYWTNKEITRDSEKAITEVLEKIKELEKREKTDEATLEHAKMALLSASESLIAETEKNKELFQLNKKNTKESEETVRKLEKDLGDVKFENLRLDLEIKEQEFTIENHKEYAKDLLVLLSSEQAEKSNLQEKIRKLQSELNQLEKVNFANIALGNASDFTEKLKKLEEDLEKQKNKNTVLILEAEEQKSTWEKNEQFILGLQKQLAAEQEEKEDLEETIRKFEAESLDLQELLSKEISKNDDLRHLNEDMVRESEEAYGKLMKKFKNLEYRLEVQNIGVLELQAEKKTLRKNLLKLGKLVRGNEKKLLKESRDLIKGETTGLAVSKSPIDEESEPNRGCPNTKKILDSSAYLDANSWIDQANKNDFHAPSSSGFVSS